MGFSRQEHWNGLPCPPPGDLTNPGIKPTSLRSPALAGEGSLPLVPPGKPKDSWAFCKCGLAHYSQILFCGLLCYSTVKKKKKGDYSEWVLAFIYQQSEQCVWGLSFHKKKKGKKPLVFKSSNMMSKLMS